jgi:hypothetical protein
MTETEIQRAIVKHYRQRAAPGVFAFAVPNGGKRRPIEAAIMKGTGTVAGVPDMIWIREGQVFGLELKADKGKLTPVQVATLEEMEGAGAICHVAYGLTAALAWLEERALLRGTAS